VTLSSFLENSWKKGTGKPATLVNPSTEELVAETSTDGFDFKKAVAFAREVGGPKLRALNFAQRGEVLRTLAKLIADGREELIELGMVNAGNTRSDAKFDIDGASGTLLYYAELGKTLGERNVLVDGEGIALGRSARLWGQHIRVPRAGVAVHINAFNFPAWGMAEKLAATFLAGMPVITKPATSTALMAHRIAEKWVASGVLPEGALTLVCGSLGDLLSHLEGQDVVAFTGSGETASTLKRHSHLATQNVRFNVEADSLNSAIVGPDVELGSETLGIFLSEVVKEITQKTGQKCTAVRRIFLPQSRLDEIRELLAERLADVKVGDPRQEGVTMGPVATAQQFRDVNDGIARLKEEAEQVLGADKKVSPSKGYFVQPHLLVNRDPKPSHLANHLEVFGPVATLMPYSDVAHLSSLVAAGGGCLVSALYSDDKKFTAEALAALAPFHGRLTVANEKLAGQTVPPGTVMPQLLHGGPGRAGGGEELGGLRGLELYTQRTAIQGPRALLEQLYPAAVASKAASGA
jgi:3,4-dehydroadipyl-CoA semialdehyde dehydrogenase